MPDSTENFRWTYDMRRQEPGRFAGLCGALIIMLAVIYFTSPEGTGAFWTFIAVLLLAFWLLPFFIPVTYELSSEGVAVFYGGLRIGFKPWDAYTRCVYDDYGIAFKTMVVDSWLDKFRGCFMRFPKGMANHAEIVAFVGRRLKVCENTAYAGRRGGKEK